MTVRSKRLFGPTAVSTAAALLYTCPAGKTAVIKDLWFWPQGPTITGVDLFINGATAGQHVAHIVMPNSADLRLTGLFLVLNEGDLFRMSSSAASCNVAGFGAELVGVA